MKDSTTSPETVTINLKTYNDMKKEVEEVEALRKIANDNGKYILKTVRYHDSLMEINIINTEEAIRTIMQEHTKELEKLEYQKTCALNSQLDTHTHNLREICDYIKRHSYFNGKLVKDIERIFLYTNDD